MARFGSFATDPIGDSAAKLGKNETLAGALEHNAADQRRIGDELAAVGNAPRTIAEAKEAMRQEVARLAERGMPEAVGIFHNQGVEWATELFQGE